MPNDSVGSSSQLYPGGFESRVDSGPVREDPRGSTQLLAKSVLEATGKPLDKMSGPEILDLASEMPWMRSLAPTLISAAQRRIAAGKDPSEADFFADLTDKESTLELSPGLLAIVDANAFSTLKNTPPAVQRKVCESFQSQMFSICKDFSLSGISIVGSPAGDMYVLHLPWGENKESKQQAKLLRALNARLAKLKVETGLTEQDFRSDSVLSKNSFLEVEEGGAKKYYFTFSVGFVACDEQAPVRETLALGVMEKPSSALLVTGAGAARGVEFQKGAGPGKVLIEEKFQKLLDEFPDEDHPTPIFPVLSQGESIANLSGDLPRDAYLRIAELFIRAIPAVADQQLSSEAKESIRTNVTNMCIVFGAVDDIADTELYGRAFKRLSQVLAQPRFKDKFHFLKNDMNAFHLLSSADLKGEAQEVRALLMAIEEAFSDLGKPWTIGMDYSQVALTQRFGQISLDKSSPALVNAVRAAWNAFKRHDGLNVVAVQSFWEALGLPDLGVRDVFAAKGGAIPCRRSSPSEFGRNRVVELPGRSEITQDLDALLEAYLAPSSGIDQKGQSARVVLPQIVEGEALSGVGLSALLWRFESKAASLAAELLPKRLSKLGEGGFGFQRALLVAFGVSFSEDNINEAYGRFLLNPTWSSQQVFTLDEEAWDEGELEAIQQFVDVCQGRGTPVLLVGQAYRAITLNNEFASNFIPPYEIGPLSIPDAAIKLLDSRADLVEAGKTEADLQALLRALPENFSLDLTPRNVINTYAPAIVCDGKALAWDLETLRGRRSVGDLGAKLEKSKISLEGRELLGVLAHIGQMADFKVLATFLKDPELGLSWMQGGDYEKKLKGLITELEGQGFLSTHVVPEGEEFGVQVNSSILRSAQALFIESGAFSKRVIAAFDMSSSTSDTDPMLYLKHAYRMAAHAPSNEQVGIFKDIAGYLSRRASSYLRGGHSLALNGLYGDFLKRVPENFMNELQSSPESGLVSDFLMNLVGSFVASENPLLHKQAQDILSRFESSKSPLVREKLLWYRYRLMIKALAPDPSLELLGRTLEEVRLLIARYAGVLSGESPVLRSLNLAGYFYQIRVFKKQMLAADTEKKKNLQNQIEALAESMRAIPSVEVSVVQDNEFVLHDCKILAGVELYRRKPDRQGMVQFSARGLEHLQALTTVGLPVDARAQRDLEVNQLRGEYWGEFDRLFRGSGAKDIYGVNLGDSQWPSSDQFEGFYRRAEALYSTARLSGDTVTQTRAFEDMCNLTKVQLLILASPPLFMNADRFGSLYARMQNQLRMRTPADQKNYADVETKIAARFVGELGLLPFASLFEQSVVNENPVVDSEVASVPNLPKGEVPSEGDPPSLGGEPDTIEGSPSVGPKVLPSSTATLNQARETVSTGWTRAQEAVKGFGARAQDVVRGAGESVKVATAGVRGALSKALGRFF